MTPFSLQQKIAIMRIILDIIHADGRIDEREILFFNKLKRDLKISDRPHVEVQSKNSLIALMQIRSFDEEQKEYFAKIMEEMIVVDEDVDVNESAIYEVVCDFSGIQKKELTTTK